MHIQPWSCFDENTGRCFLASGAQTYAEELGIELDFRYTNPKGKARENGKLEENKIGMWIKKRCEEVRRQKCQGKLVVVRWEDANLDREYLSWMLEWRTASTHNSMRSCYQSSCTT